MSRNFALIAVLGLEAACMARSNLKSLMGKLLGACLASAVSTSPMFAQEYEQGWGIYYRQDSFTKKIYPLAVISETGVDILANNLIIACGNGSSLVVVFSESTVFFGVGPYPVSFRFGDEVIEYTFNLGEIPNLKSHFRITDEESAQFISKMIEAHEEIGYQTKTKQGKFSTIAADRMVPLMRSECSAVEQAKGG